MAQGQGSRGVCRRGWLHAPDEHGLAKLLAKPVRRTWRMLRSH